MSASHPTQPLAVLEITRCERRDLAGSGLSAFGGLAGKSCRPFSDSCEGRLPTRVGPLGDVTTQFDRVHAMMEIACGESFAVRSSRMSLAVPKYSHWLSCYRVAIWWLATALVCSLLIGVLARTSEALGPLASIPLALVTCFQPPDRVATQARNTGNYSLPLRPPRKCRHVLPLTRRSVGHLGSASGPGRQD